MMSQDANLTYLHKVQDANSNDPWRNMNKVEVSVYKPEVSVCLPLNGSGSISELNTPIALTWPRANRLK